MNDPKVDADRLREIERLFQWEGPPGSTNDIVQELLPLARDGLKWRKAAAAEGQRQAASDAFNSIANKPCFPPTMESALQAAAAHRAAHGAIHTYEREIAAAQLAVMSTLKAIEADIKRRIADLEKEKQGASMLPDRESHVVERPLRENADNRYEPHDGPREGRLVERR